MTPDEAALVLQQGVAHHRSGQLDEAEKLYRRVLDADPANADALNFLGVAAFQTGRGEEAVGFIRQALKTNPDNPDALNNLGQAYESLGRRGDAIAAYRKAIDGVENFAPAMANLAAALLEEGKPEEAASLFEQAGKAFPDDPDILCGFARALASLDRLEAAISCLRRAREISPDDPEILVNLGTIHQQDGKPEEAVAWFEAAIALHPEFVEAHYNLGLAFQEQGRPDDAVGSYGRALKIDPSHIMSHVNLGGALLTLGRIDQSAASQRRAIAIDPDHAEAHHNLGLALLLQGNFEQGWPEYEGRLRANKNSRVGDFPQALWRGEAVKGKKILAWAEQGVGDEIMFAGMIQDLQGQGANVVLESDRRLQPLFERSFPGTECIAKRSPPAADALRDEINFQTPSGNLGRWLRPDLKSFPVRASYLVADTGKRDQLRAQYQAEAGRNAGGGGGGGLLAGIAWTSKNKSHGPEKSMQLMDFAPLTRVPGITWIDLQYGDTADERKDFERQAGVSIFHDDGFDQMVDLDTFAAQVAAMDLVISVSNTAVHMAGALGVRTWVMLNTVPLPCWMLEGTASPWYPSVRLFRQQTPGHWEDVVGRVGNELSALAATVQDR